MWRFRPPGSIGFGLDWTGLDWTGLDWIGLDSTGLDWTGLAWTGLDWTGLDWTGPLFARFEAAVPLRVAVLKPRLWGLVFGAQPKLGPAPPSPGQPKP